MDRVGLAPARLRGAGDGRASRPGERPRPDGADQGPLQPPVLWLATVLVVGANTYNIGADLAEAFRLLVPVPFALVVVATAVVILLLRVFVSYDRTR